MQPGQTITPGGTVEPPEAPKNETSAELTIAHDQPVQPVVPVPATPEPTPVIQAETAETAAPAEPSPWQYSSAENSSPVQPVAPVDAAVSWSASEYIAHHKGLSWFVSLGLVIAVLAIGIYIFTRGIFSPIMIIICGVVFGVFAARQPRVLEYAINRSGLKIGEKLYSFDNFKSFSVIEEGVLHSILLTPLQRFMPPITMYYDPSDEDRIMAVLGDYLPFAEAPRDAVDSLMRRVRF